MRTRSHAERRQSKSGDEPSVGAPRRTCAVLMDAVSSPSTGIPPTATFALFSSEIKYHNCFTSTKNQYAKKGN